MLHPIRNYFNDYVPSDFRHVLLGDDEPCKIVGKDKVQIKLNNVNDWLLKDVRHILAMQRNLISTGNLGDSSFLSTFGKMWWNITKGALVIAKGDRICTFYLSPHNIDYCISVASTKMGAIVAS